MQAKLIIGLVIAILVIMFTIQNQAPVQVRLFLWSFEQIPVSVAIFFAILIGAVITFLIGLRGKLKLNHELKAKSERVAELEHRLKAHKTEIGD